MSKVTNLPHTVDIIAQLADLKELDYNNMLILTALVELLIDKKILSREELIYKANELDTSLPSMDFH